MDVEAEVRAVYGDVPISPCPFTDREIAQLDETGEFLVYVPPGLSMRALCERLGVLTNVHFENEARMIRDVMVDEGHWFICSSSKVPELLYKSGQAARRTYEDEGLHGMDVRRYLAFCAAFKYRFDVLPDQTSWTIHLSGSYDRSGTSIIGFDASGVLSHHGWMKNFKAKFVGSRYIVLAPRIEILPETRDLPLARRGMGGLHGGSEADLDRS